MRASEAMAMSVPDPFSSHSSPPLWTGGPSVGGLYNFPATSSGDVAPSRRTLRPTVTGTSVLGITFEGGVMLAADTLGSYGSLARFRSLSRLRKITDTTVMAATGDYADFQHLDREFESIIMRSDSLNDGHKYSPQNLFNLLTRYMYFRRCRFNPLWNSIIVGGFEGGKPIKMTQLDFGSLSLTSGPKGVSLTDSSVSLAATADWSYREESWPHLKDDGSVDISGSGISLSVTVNVTMNKTTGGVHVNCTQCSFTIDKLSVTFHGGKSWLYNLFDSVIEDKLKDLMNDQMCSRLTGMINTAGNGALEKLLNVTYPVGHGVEMDYALVSDPDFSHPGIIIVDSKGEFRLVSSQQEPPFSPPPLPDPSLRNLTSMVYVQATTYVAESASWAFWKAGLMAYNVTNDEIPAGFQTTAFYCDIVAPELCKKFPNEKVMFGIVASDYPRVQVTPEAAVMTGVAHASMYVMDKGRYVLAFTLEIKVKADMQFWFNFSSSRGQYVICGNVSNPKVDISLYKSNIGQFNVSTLQNMVKTLAPSIGLAYINKKINGGIPIPTAEGLSFIKPSLTFGKGYVEVSGDVSYSPEILNKLRKGTL